MPWGGISSWKTTDAQWGWYSRSNGFARDDVKITEGGGNLDGSASAGKNNAEAFQYTSRCCGGIGPFKKIEIKGSVYYWNGDNWTGKDMNAGAVGRELKEMKVLSKINENGNVIIIDGC